jgi:hypothetical protein
LGCDVSLSAVARAAGPPGWRSGWRPAPRPDHQAGTSLVDQVDHHRLGGIVHIPEHPVTLVVEGASHDHPRTVRLVSMERPAPVRICVGHPH